MNSNDDKNDGGGAPPVQPVRYDRHGRLVAAGGHPVEYDERGRVVAMNGCPVEYDDHDRLIAANGHPVQYDKSGRIAAMAGFPVLHDQYGRMRQSLPHQPEPWSNLPGAEPVLFDGDGKPMDRFRLSPNREGEIVPW